jgi:hypothetical protein
LHPYRSVAVTEKLKVPFDVGIPDIRPADERDNPGGREPEESAYRYGPVPPEAEILPSYTTPTLPF